MSKTQKIVLTSLMIAAAFVIGELLKLFSPLRMANGGSISLTMLPIFLLAYAIGEKYGILGGLIYGIINFFFDGYAFHWSSLLFDYILAFGCLGLVGIISSQVKKNNMLFFFGGMFVATTLRMVFHTIAGMLAYETPLIPSFIYNAPYCYLSFILCCIVGYYVKDSYFAAIKRLEKNTEV